MSSNWMLVRGGSANPSSLKFAALMNKQSIAENELFKPEKQQPDIISAHVEDLVAIQDPFMFTKLKQKTIHYRGGYEPDGYRLRLWAKFDHIANIMKDRSMSVNAEDYPTIIIGNSLRPNGNPKLCEGPDFDGLKGGSIVSKLNSDPDIVDYYHVLNPLSNLLGIQTSFDFGHVGFSMFFRFMLEGEPVQHNGKDPTLWFQYDSGGNNFFATVVRIGTNKSLKFFVRDNDVEFNFISPANAIVPNTWTTACLTYRFSNTTPTMTINNVPQTDSASESLPTPLEELEDGVFIGAEYGSAIDGIPVPPSGRFIGRLDDIRWYTDLVFNRDHETNIWNNGRSICAANVISFGADANDYVDLTNDSSLWSQALTKFSYSFWIYRNSFTGSRTLNHGWESGGGFVSFGLTGTVDFLVTNNANTQWLIAEASGSLTNSWEHVTCVYDSTLGSANVKIYLNGVVGGITDNHTETKNLSATLTLGHPSIDSFNGNIKDFRWWTNKALTPTEILAVRDNKSNAPLPNYWLKLVEGNGNPVDSITRTKVGTLTNGAVWVVGSSPRPIEYGSLAVAGYSRFNDTVDTGGFTTEGFDSDGFDTT